MSWFNSFKVEIGLLCIILWIPFLSLNEMVVYVNVTYTFLMCSANEGVWNKFYNSISGFIVNHIVVNSLAHLIWLDIFKIDLLHSLKKTISSNLTNAMGFSCPDYYCEAYRYVMTSPSLYNCDLSSLFWRSHIPKVKGSSIFYWLQFCTLSE